MYNFRKQKFFTMLKKFTSTTMIALALLLLLAVGQTNVKAQATDSVVTNLVIFEHFTNASCGPCASQNPMFTNLLNNNPYKATSIKYHVSWPGFDPMYNVNTTEPTSRVNYYGVQGVPSVRLGSFGNMSPISVTQNQVNQFHNSLLDAWNYNFQTTLDGNQLQIVGQVSANRTLTQSDHILHIVLIEDQVRYPNPPGSNGEKDFESVVRKMMPNAQGTAVGLGDTPTPLNLSYTVPAGFNTDSLYIVVFVQANATKIVYKGAKIKVGAAIASSVNEMSAYPASVLYPNPATDATQIDYELTTAAEVSLTFTNVLGQQVLEIKKGQQNTGLYQERIDISALKSGLYMVELRRGNQLQTHRLVKP